MSEKMTALLIAGALPAVLYGISALFQKLSTSQGIGLPVYLFAVGIGVALAGLLVGVMLGWNANTFEFSVKAFLYANGFGLLWGLASGLVAVGLLRYQVPISQLVPLYNMNTLVAVLLALFFFSEWKDLNAVKLIAGSGLVVLGGVLVSTA